MATLTKERPLWFTLPKTKNPFSQATIVEIRAKPAREQNLPGNWVGDESSGFTREDLESRIAERRVKAPKVLQEEVVISLSELTDCQFEVFLAGLPRNSKRKSAHHPKIAKNPSGLFEETAGSPFVSPVQIG